MLLHLIKKDFLLVKKYALMMIVLCTFIPLFTLWRIPTLAGPVGFCLSVIFAIFMLLQYLLLKETQFPKAATLLCSTPYPRELLVLSKYSFCLIIYAACCVIFGLETLVFHQLGGIHLELPSVVFFILSVFLGIYMPVLYKLGYEKTKFVFVVTIMGSCFALPQLMEISSKVNLGSLAAISPSIFYGGVILISLIILAISASLSIKIYSKADLA
ncbi:ABC-2 transporter permease [Aminipila terrae]|nr:ABC-2 transporter permease [Aminipila terrae]